MTRTLGVFARAIQCSIFSASFGVLFGAGNLSAQEVDTLAPEQLEAQRVVIGEIRIVNGNVFATETHEENKSLFRLANRLHIKSRKDLIAQQLLFKSGEPYSRRLMLESERILRSNRYLYDATIIPIAVRDGVVDIEVRTRDVWTLKPGVNFSRSGGENSSGFEIQESNLLGYGKEITVARRSHVDRDTSEYRYSDPRLFGSWNRFLGSYSSNSDGRRRYLSLQRPFYSHDTRWAASSSFLDFSRTDQRYDLGQVVDEFRHFQERYDVSGGVSTGWRDGWIERFSFGATYGKDRFTATDSLLSASVLPQDRLLAYPFIGFTLLQDDYEKRRNQDQIERTEDLYAGTFVQASIGRAQANWGSDRDAWLWSLSAGTSFEWQQRKHTVVLNGDAAGRIEGREQRNVLGHAALTYYFRVTPRQLFYSSLRASSSYELDAERQLTLGGDTGLRGYPLRYQDGTAQALFTLEHRVFTKYYLFRLFHVGGAVFFDAGRSWGRGNARVANPNWVGPAVSEQGLLKDVGLGLRFGSSRSAFGNVIHVDLAFPLDGDRSIDHMQFIVETKSSF